MRRQCFHCKQWIDDGQAHDCWTTTERALTTDLPEDLRDAWERLREEMGGFGEQRIYASHNSIMFARQACYAFVRPKTKFLEVVFFLGRTVRTAPVRKSMASSRHKVAHEVRVVHRDQVEAPLTAWLREAYEQSDALTALGKATRRRATPARRTKAGTRRKTGSKQARGRARSARR